MIYPNLIGRRCRAYERRAGKLELLGIGRVSAINADTGKLRVVGTDLVGGSLTADVDPWSVDWLDPESTTAPALTIGTVVRLKSGGPEMTVERAGPTSSGIYCARLDGECGVVWLTAAGEVRRERFAGALLDVVPAMAAETPSPIGRACRLKISGLGPSPQRVVDVERSGMLHVRGDDWPTSMANIRVTPGDLEWVDDEVRAAWREKHGIPQP